MKGSIVSWLHCSCFAVPGTTRFRGYVVVAFAFVFAPIAVGFVFSFDPDCFPALPLGHFTLRRHETIALVELSRFSGRSRDWVSCSFLAAPLEGHRGLPTEADRIRAVGLDPPPGSQLMRRVRRSQVR